MLTRIEIDGFKSFAGFAVDLEPFTVVLGPNASGKSNLFDAIRFLSALAETDVRSAVRRLRGEPHEIFRRQRGTTVESMRFAAEVVLDRDVRDSWGGTVELTHTRVRYEVEVRLVRDERGIERLTVTHEAALPILARDDQWARKPDVSSHFRRAFLRYRRTAPWLETVESRPDRREFKIHQDGRQGRTNTAEVAESTVLSTLTSAEFRHLYALRAELRSWKFLQLDAAALRQPSEVTDADDLAVDGSNLATVLARIQAETADAERPRGVLPEIAADLASLIPGIVDLQIEKDERDRKYRIDILLRDEPPLTSRVVSDGTLRVLALLTLLHDPRHRGLVCFEEPENGVHPGRLRDLIARLRELACDVGGADVPSTMTQVVLNTHSPVVLASLRAARLLSAVFFADMVTVVEPGVGTSHRTRLRPVCVEPQASLGLDQASVGTFDVERYLSSAQPSGTPLP